VTAIEWDRAGERLFETGIDHGILFLGPANADYSYTQGYAWNGLLSVEQAVSGGEAEALYFDGDKYLDYIQNEDYAANISAYGAPLEFDACEGVQALYSGLNVGNQRRIPFGFSYRTLIGNDTEGVRHAYKLHLVYNAMVTPSARSYTTISDSPQPMLKSWSVVSTPPPVTSTIKKYKRTAHIEIDSRYAWPDGLQTIEQVLRGDASNPPRMPTQKLVIDWLQD
jgi:hypothetical protein